MIINTGKPDHFGMKRRHPESIKRQGWREEGILVIKADDDRLSWVEQEFIEQLGEKLYGQRKGGQGHD
ncbi:MAG: hypothetical protein PsegKO_36350 [Pseudohongiellaceae bacterium]